MPIEFRCAGCGQTLRVPDESAGRSARCPKCQTIVTIPAASVAPASPPVPPQPHPFPTQPYPTQPYPTQPYPTHAPAPQPAHKPFAAFGPPPGSLPPKPPEPNLNPYASSPLPPGVSAYGPPNPNQGPLLLAIASLVTGVVGLFSCGCCLFLPFPAISLTLGIIALCQKPDQQTKVMATIGVVISAILLLVFLVGMLVAAVNGIMEGRIGQDLGLE